jgi:hypothetical protein
VEVNEFVRTFTWTRPHTFLDALKAKRLNKPVKVFTSPFETVSHGFRQRLLRDGHARDLTCFYRDHVQFGGQLGADDNGSEDSSIRSCNDEG